MFQVVCASMTVPMDAITVHSDGTVFRKQGAYAYSIWHPSLGITPTVFQGICEADSFVAELTGIVEALKLLQSSRIPIVFTVDHKPLFERLNKGKSYGQRRKMVTEILKLAGKRVTWLYEPGSVNCLLRHEVHHAARCAAIGKTKGGKIQNVRTDS